MLNKFFKFLLGYVIIDVYGKNAVRFLNICLRRGMKVLSAVYIEGGMEISISAGDFIHIRGVARKCRVKVKIREKHSLTSKMHLYRRRYVFMIVFLLCIISAVIMSQYIWLVEINGANENNIAAIEQTLSEMGVRRGGRKSALPDGMEMKRLILANNEQVAWAWVYIEGAKARVEIYEKIMPPALINKNEPCDILARCDGVIEKMTVKEGEERAKKGDVVKTGDLLVAGTVPVFKEGEEEKYILVHSIAEVKAHTSHSATGVYTLYHEPRKPTGRMKRRRVLEVFGKAFAIPFGKMNYENYDRRESRHEINIPFFGYSGIAINTVEFSEVWVTKEILPQDTVLEYAKIDLEKKIASELGLGSVKEDEKLEYTKLDDETIEVTLKMDFMENIAAAQPISPAG